MVWRQHKRDFIFFEQRRHIERHYGRTPSAVGAPALGAQDSIRFGDWRGCLGGQQRAPKSGYPDGYEIKVTCDSLSSRMLPYHQYPIPQREPLLRIIRNRGKSTAACPTPQSHQPSYGCRSAYSEDQELEH